MSSLTSTIKDSNRPSGLHLENLKKKTPTLRFPNFSEEWQLKKLDSIASFSKGKNITKSDISKEGFECIRYGELYTHYGEVIKDVISKTNLKKSELIFSEYNDVIIPASGETQLDIAKASCVLKDGIALGGDLNIIKTKINGIFLSYYLNNQKRMEIAKMAQGNSVVHLYSSQLKTLHLNLPSILEQQKIASFLTAIDNKIQQLTKKKELLQQYKRGCMQQIFSQQIRFKDDNGNDFPNWEVKRLGEILAFYSTNSLSRSQLNYENGEIKNIHYGDIHTKFKSNFDIRNEYVPYINNDVAINKIPKECYCRSGDLIIADASEDYKDVGKSIEIIEVNGQKLLAGLHTYLARDIKSPMALGFKGYLFQSQNIREQMMKLATGISVLSISKGNISKMEIKLPCYEEQQKISSFLTAIDKKIDLIDTQLTKTQQYKKGLLQQMFV